MAEESVIAQRFCGPPSSGNGGYVCGVVAQHVPGEAEVTLLSPPPLDTPLTVVRDGEDVHLLDGDRPVAHGRRRQAALDGRDVASSPRPSRADAEAAAARYPGHNHHVFPTCFTCGPARGDDALRIFCGAVEGHQGLVAAPWTPAADLVAPDGRVGPEFMWAALDCPTYWALPGAGMVPAVLGRLAVVVTDRPAPGQDLVVVAWPRPEESAGRKHRAGAAIYDAAGRLLARSEAVWIEIDPARFS